MNGKESTVRMRYWTYSDDCLLMITENGIKVLLNISFNKSATLRYLWGHVFSLLLLPLPEHKKKKKKDSETGYVPLELLITKSLYAGKYPV